jgi:predicted nucleic acid-binding protein
MTATRFLDTNILLYSISDNARERAKRDIAVGLLEQDDNGLSVQVLQEFYVQATRATRPHPLPHEIAAGLVRTWLLRCRIQDVTVSILSAALDIKSVHRLSYWDAAIIAAAQAIGCRDVLSEDMSHGRQIEGILIVNPFRKAA